MTISIHIDYSGQRYSLSWTDEVKFTEFVRHQVGYFMWSGPTLNDLKSHQSFNDLATKRYWDDNLELVKSLDHPKVVLDIGSGIGIFDLYLSQIFPDTKFYLLDKSKLDSIIGYKIFVDDIKDYGFYNNWDVTKDGIKTSGLNQDNFIFLDPSDNIPSNIDAIISTYSWPWHYPLNTYWDRIKDNISSNGKLFLDVRFDVDAQQISSYLGCNPRLIRHWYTPKFYPVSYGPTLGKRYLWNLSQ